MAAFITAILQLVLLPFTLTARLRDRVLGALVIHVDEYRFVGQRSEPAIWIQGIWTENTSNQDAFVDDYDVTLTVPIEAVAKSTEWRERGRPVVIIKGDNVPAFGRTKPVDLLVHFVSPLPSSSGTYVASVAARGRKGFRRRATAIGGQYQIADI